MSYLHIPKFFDTKQISEDLKASSDWFVHREEEFHSSESSVARILELPQEGQFRERIKAMLEVKQDHLIDLLDCVFDAKHRSPLTESVFTFKYYEPGIGIGHHVDVSAIGLETFTTLLIYFNDDYEGGELAVEQKVINDIISLLTIKPEAGDLIAITYDHFHEARPTTKGNKYIAVAQIPAEFKNYTVAEDTVGKI
jgi:predicted 2-oxoglutarate/Fe(II)-dependent dioxygenase YbiX